MDEQDEAGHSTTSFWSSLMPKSGVMWKETDFWGDVALELRRSQLLGQDPSAHHSRPATTPADVSGFSLLRPHRAPSPYSGPVGGRFRRRDPRIERDIQKRRERAFRGGDVSLGRAFIEMHMPASVVLREDIVRADAAQHAATELIKSQDRRKEASKYSQRLVRKVSRSPSLYSNARKEKKASRRRTSNRASEARADGDVEDVQMMLRRRERRSSLLGERPAQEREERKKSPELVPRLTINYADTAKLREALTVDEPSGRSGSPSKQEQERNLSGRARRLVQRQRQKLAQEKSKDKKFKDVPTSARAAAMQALQVEGERIAEMIRMKDEEQLSDFERYDEDGDGLLQLTEIRGVLEDAGLLPRSAEEKAGVRRSIVNMSLGVQDGETDEENEIEQAGGSAAQAQINQTRLARSVALSQSQMPALLSRIRRRFRTVRQKKNQVHFNQTDTPEERELEVAGVLRLLQDLKYLPDSDEARSDFGRWLLSTVRSKTEQKEDPSQGLKGLSALKRSSTSAAPKAEALLPQPTRRTTTTRTRTSRVLLSSEESDNASEVASSRPSSGHPDSRAVRIQSKVDILDMKLGDNEARRDFVVLEDLPRLLTDMKFDKDGFEVMVDFLEEAHGRLAAKRQLQTAEELGLRSRTLFQEFRKELEAQQDLFHSFDDTHSGVLKKVEVWVALSNLGLLPSFDQNKVGMLVMISLACEEATRASEVCRRFTSGNAPRLTQRFGGTKAALKALLQGSEFLSIASHVGSLDEGCMDFQGFLTLVHAVRQMVSGRLREELRPVFDRMLRRRKRLNNSYSEEAVSVLEVSQALEELQLGPRQRDDQAKIYELLNEVNEFGFQPLTLDFESFVRFVRQVKEWQAMRHRAEDRGYGANLNLDERQVDEYRVIFDIIDVHGNGELDLTGVKRAYGLLQQKSLPFEELRRFFETLDLDSSGSISFREFLHMTNLVAKQHRYRAVPAGSSIFSPRRGSAGRGMSPFLSRRSSENA